MFTLRRTLSGFILPLGLLTFTSAVRGQAPPPKGEREVEELARGPIHEAFGQPTSFDPEPGPVIEKAPPEPVEELPPDQKPEGDNVAWMPGYWSWDDEAKEHIWVSGFWRTLPPERKWVSGYWTKVEGGHQWVSGFWASDKTTELEYLPPPPESLENGPTGEVPDGQIWNPGCWIWQSNRYAWRPGYFTVANADWVWAPDHYEWTPNGYIFVNGYYDYPMYRRGLLFAPARFGTIAPGFVYTPSVVIDTRFLTLSLFARPAYGHYYFGDYYAASYVRGGIYPWYSFHYSRFGYDPLYAHTSLVLGRQNPRWDDDLRAAYIARRDNDGIRPPHTYSKYVDWSRKTAAAGGQPLALARPITEINNDRDFPVRVNRVTENQIKVIQNQAKQVREFRGERGRMEQGDGKPPAKGATIPKRAPRTEPGRVQLPNVPKSGGSPGKGGPGVKLPTSPQFPQVNPMATPPAVRGKGRTLPDPDDIIRRPAPKATPQPQPKVNPPKGNPNPPPKVNPPKGNPGKGGPPPKGNPGKGKDKD